VDINSAIKAITSIASPLLINQAKRNETVIKILQELGLNQAHPPKDFDVVYVYALVEYGVSKPEPILQLFREKTIQKAFRQAFYDNNYSFMVQEVENWVGWELQDWNTLGQKIRELKLDLRQELVQFSKAFLKVAERTRTPDEVMQARKIDAVLRKLEKIEQNINQYTLPKVSEQKHINDVKVEPYPEEFKALIQEKIKTFCGRKFVFAKFDQFREDNSHGYFTVVGDAGMGKSAIAANYVSRHHNPCYFNIRAEGRNRPELFLKSLRQQLINRYRLDKAEDADLATLLEKVSKQLGTEEQLVIIVDALDEVEQEPGGNLLHLPMTLPNQVYFLLTRRPYNLGKKRLNISPGVPMAELDLTASEYAEFSRDDVKEYIRFILNHDPEYKNALRQWITQQQITAEEFVEQVAAKSENNFMYLRYVLPGIAGGIYDNLSLKELPQGLQEYYQTHWQRMGMDTERREIMVIILFILVEIATSITCEMIAGIAQQDECEVQLVLDKWVEYLRRQEIEREICYSFYHASFLDFLKAKRELKPTRKLFQQVNQRISEYLYQV